MISDRDKQLLTEAGREYIFDAVIHSRKLKDTLTVSEHIDLTNYVNKLTYEEVITLTITEDIRAFEGKFKKFLKYSFAALAGMVLGPGAPTVAVIGLFLYRKFTDDCHRECSNLPMFSGQRKLCKQECELDAAKKVFTRIRSDISKCGQMHNPDRCEKKLLKEQIKWGKRVQLLTIKVNATKSKVRDIEYKKQSDQEYRYDSYNISKGDNTKIVYEQGPQPAQPAQKAFEPKMKMNPKVEKYMRLAVNIGMFFTPVPYFRVIVNHLIKKYSVGCIARCIAQNKIPKQVCYGQCAYLGAKYASDYLTGQLSKCKQAKNPEKCRNKINKMLADWKTREIERKLRFEALLRKNIRHAKEKNAKIQAKQAAQQGNQ